MDDVDLYCDESTLDDKEKKGTAVTRSVLSPSSPPSALHGSLAHTKELIDPNSFDVHDLSHDQRQHGITRGGQKRIHRDGEEEPTGCETTRAPDTTSDASSRGSKRLRYDEEKEEKHLEIKQHHSHDTEEEEARDNMRARERVLLRYHDPLLSLPHLVPHANRRTADCSKVARACTVIWILELGLAHKDTKCGTLPTSAVNDFAEVVVMLDPDEMLDVAVLAVSYWDALMDGAGAERTLPIVPPRQNGDGQGAMCNVAAMACYLTACKFTLLDDADGTQAMRNSSKYLVEQCLANSVQKDVKRCLQQVELYLWTTVLQWRAWRPTPVVWLHDASRHFAVPDIARLMFALPVLLLDTALSRTVYPSELALCIVLCSKVEITAGDDVLCAFFLGKNTETGRTTVPPQPPVVEAAPSEQRTESCLREQRHTNRSSRLQQIMARICDILWVVIEQQQQQREEGKHGNTNDQLLPGLSGPSGWSKWFVQESLSVWKNICLKCCPTLPGLFSPRPTTVPQSVA